MVLHVVAHGLEERGERLRVTARAQLRYVGAGVILILAAQRLRHVDELDFGFAVERGEDGARERQPGVRLPGAEVEEAGGGGAFGG